MSVQDLERVLPALLRHRAPTARTIDWDALSGALGTALPSDFMELTEKYPALAIGDFLAIHIPDPGEEHSFVEGMREDLEVLGDLRDSGMSHGHVPYPEARGLLPWGDSSDGDLFYWKTTDEGPDTWTILVSGRNDDWCEFKGGLTEYLAGLVSGTVPPDGLPPDFPGRTPSVDSD
ncbi:hypothetical protein GCM10010349_44470 [Streptomyces flavofungini]|nr:hypothetical protein GCM10010349_44470 [Streptomyces flavofungini]